MSHFRDEKMVWQGKEFAQKCPANKGKWTQAVRLWGQIWPQWTPTSPLKIQPKDPCPIYPKETKEEVGTYLAAGTFMDVLFTIGRYKTSYIFAKYPTAKCILEHSYNETLQVINTEALFVTFWFEVFLP